MRGSILLVEDDAAIATVITTALEDEGFSVDRTDSIAGRDRLLESGDYAAMLTDVVLTDGDGIASLPAVRQVSPRLPVIVLSAQNTLDTAVRATDVAAFEYFPKPFDLEELVRTVLQAAGRRAGAGEAAADEPGDALPLVGRSQAMQGVYRMITRVLRNDLSVLILGESGTGKELVAEAIHQLGHRRSGPFVAVNAAAIPRDLLESELFGHEKGAFTGAIAQAIGKFEQANGGTLFLDEIGDMPLEAQTRLLRALQSGRIRRVGGRQEIGVDVRILAATNRDLGPMIAAGTFREDLYYRLAVVPIELPPLRERRSDVAALTKHFLAQAAAEGLPQRQIDPAGAAALERRPWRGNVRELRNAVYRLALLTREDTIDGDTVDAVLGPPISPFVTGACGICRCAGSVAARLSAAGRTALRSGDRRAGATAIRPRVGGDRRQPVARCSPAWDQPQHIAQATDRSGDRSQRLRTGWLIAFAGQRITLAYVQQCRCNRATMASSPPIPASVRSARRSPRWRRRFIVSSRRANLYLFLELTALIAFLAMVWSAWYTFTSAPPDGQLLPSRRVAVLLIGTLIPAMALLVLLGRRLALRRAEGSTARLHVRLVFFFSLVAAVPTLLVAGFAAILFQSGVDFWFSDNSRGLMQNANALARGYYEQNQVQVANQTVAMASDMQYYLQSFKLTDPDLADIYVLQVKQREINKSAVVQQVPDGSIRIAAVIDLNSDNRPTAFASQAVPKLKNGDAVVVSGNTKRIEAIAPIDLKSGIFLYNARNSRIDWLQSVVQRPVYRGRVRRADKARAGAATALQPRTFYRQSRAGRAGGVVRASLRGPSG